MGLKNDATNTVKEEKLFYQGEIIGKGKEYLGKEYTYNVKVISGNKIGQGSNSIEVYKNVPVMGNDGTVSPELEEGDTVFLSFMNKNNNDPVIVSNDVSKSSGSSAGSGTPSSGADSGGTPVTGVSGGGYVDFDLQDIANDAIKNYTFTWPCPSTNLYTSLFGYRPTSGRNHTGVDLNARFGSDIVAATDGTVQSINTELGGGGYGRYVYIESPTGIVTMYAHGSQILVSKGQQVTAGQVVMKSGQSGYTETQYAAHLHFEVIAKTDGSKKWFNPRYVHYKEGAGNDTNIFPVWNQNSVTGSNEYQTIPK